MRLGKQDSDLRRVWKIDCRVNVDLDLKILCQNPFLEGQGNVYLVLIFYRQLNLINQVIGFEKSLPEDLVNDFLPHRNSPVNDCTFEAGEAICPLRFIKMSQNRFHECRIQAGPPPSEVSRRISATWIGLADSPSSWENTDQRAPTYRGHHLARRAL